MEIRYSAANRVGHLHFEVCNGAMDLLHCQSLFSAYMQAVEDPTTGVIVLWGGEEFFSNGIDLNSIHNRYNPAILAYKNLKAINKVVRAILETSSKMTIAALQGPAAAGGVMLALAADLRYARRGVVLNPSYVNIGLSGSEYWSILLPSMVGFGNTQKILYEASPIACRQAVEWGLIHEEGNLDRTLFREEVTAKAEYFANGNLHARLATKVSLNTRLLKEADEQVALELQKMKDCCNHPEFEASRTDFVLKQNGCKRVLLNCQPLGKDECP